MNNSGTGKSIPVAANKVAEQVVGNITDANLHKDLLVSLKAGISNEDQEQLYEETKVFKKELKLAVIHLKKTLIKTQKFLRIFGSNTYKIILEGKIVVFEAKNQAALESGYKFVNRDVKLALKNLVHTDTEDASTNVQASPPQSKTNLVPGSLVQSPPGGLPPQPPMPKLSYKDE